MNEAQPISDFALGAGSAGLKDRRTGLLIFGIFEIILGILCLVMTRLLVLGQVVAGQTTGTAFDVRMIVPLFLTYIGLAKAFVWLGIGSIKGRRWARALTLILAWSWLCVGVITVPLIAFLTPRILAASAPPGQGLPAGTLGIVLAFQIVFMSILLVVIPAVLVFFYGSRHVKAACELSDPAPRWTDACPLPAWAVACWLWLGGAIMLICLPFSFHGAIPFFGKVLSGTPGALVGIGVAAVWLWLGWLWYRLKVAGWWTLLGTLLLFGISGAITFSRVDIIELYQKMGYPQAQLDLIRQQGLISGQFVVWLSLIWLAPMLGYLLWVKGFFRAPRQAEVIRDA